MGAGVGRGEKEEKGGESEEKGGRRRDKKGSGVGRGEKKEKGGEKEEKSRRRGGAEGGRYKSDDVKNSWEKGLQGKMKLRDKRKDFRIRRK